MSETFQARSASSIEAFIRGSTRGGVIARKWDRRYHRASARLRTVLAVQAAALMSDVAQVLTIV